VEQTLTASRTPAPMPRSQLNKPQFKPKPLYQQPKLNNRSPLSKLHRL